ncbi:hypothetical protein D3C87_1887370 [compost metagenome]
MLSTIFGLLSAIADSRDEKVTSDVELPTVVLSTLSDKMLSGARLLMALVMSHSLKLEPVLPGIESKRTDTAGLLA